MTSIFGKDALDAQVKRLPDVEPETAGIGGTATSDGDFGIQGAVNKDIGKPGGWFVLAEGSWMRKAGGSVAGWIGWKGKGAK